MFVRFGQNESFGSRLDLLFLVFAVQCFQRDGHTVKTTRRKMDEDVESITLNRVDRLHRARLVQQKILHLGQIVEAVGVEVGEFRQVDSLGLDRIRAVDGDRLSRLRFRTRLSCGLVLIRVFLVLFVILV